MKVAAVKAEVRAAEARARAAAGMVVAAGAGLEAVRAETSANSFTAHHHAQSKLKA